jgi:aminoglycoside phosphotransferase (APT) family kinase protein
MNAPDVDLDAIATGLAATFPDLGDVAPCSVLGWGFGSVVVETAGTIVFRVPRIPNVHLAFERQRSLLAAIGPRLPVAVPQPLWLTGPCDALPQGAIGYPKVPGRIMTEASFHASDRAALAESLALFLAALHAVPAVEVPMLRSRNAEQRMEKEREVRDDVLPVLRQRFTADEFALAEAWWERYVSDPQMMTYEPVVTHGDLWWANFLVDESGSRLTGVLDWELASIADPARDFGGLGYLGVDFMTSVIAAYERLTGRDDTALHHRSGLLLQVRAFYGVRYANAFPEMREMDDALTKVRRVIGAAE